MFPTASTAPKNADNDDEPTINLMTKNPAFQINEELDSLAIRYHRGRAARKPSRQGYGSGQLSVLETTVYSLVTWPVDDTTFVERQRIRFWRSWRLTSAGNASVESRVGRSRSSQGLR